MSINIAQLREAQTLAKEAELLMKRDIRDFLEARSNENTILKRYRRVTMTPALKNELGALHAEELRLVPILQRFNSNLANINGLINTLSGEVRGIPPQKQVELLVAALGHTNSALTELGLIMPIDVVIHNEIARLRISHDALIGHLERVQTDFMNMMGKIANIIHPLRTLLVQLEMQART